MGDSTAFTIGGPGPGGSGFDKAQHVEHVLSFVEPVHETRNGTSGPYEVALCAYALCHTCRTGWPSLAVSGTALAPHINNADAEIVAGKLVVGEGKPGRTPPYLLEEASPDELERINDDYTKYATKMPTGKILVDLESFAADEPF
jgi:hypothetical protein